MLAASVKDNTVTIEKSDYSRVTVYLNDALVNLDQPVKVVYPQSRHHAPDLERAWRPLLHLPRLCGSDAIIEGPAPFQRRPFLSNLGLD